jgi:hypothetical protein
MRNTKTCNEGSKSLKSPHEELPARVDCLAREAEPRCSTFQGRALERGKRTTEFSRILLQPRKEETPGSMQGVESFGSPVNWPPRRCGFTKNQLKFARPRALLDLQPELNCPKSNDI